MTTLKLVLAVGFVLGAGALAWTADVGGRVKARRVVASIKREVAAFVKFVGEDASDAKVVTGESKFKERPATTGKQPKSWSLGRPV